MRGTSREVFYTAGSEIIRIVAKRFRIFNSLGVISLLVMVAMVLTTITGSASTEQDAQIRQQSLIQSHLLAQPATAPNATHASPH